MEALHLVGRIIFAGYFVYNGLNHLFMGTEMLTGYAQMKGVPAARAMVYLSGILLLLGGLSLLLGVQPYWGVVLLLAFLVPVTFKMHAFWGEQGEAAQNDQLHFMKNFALAGAALMFLAIPEPWPFSL